MTLFCIGSIVHCWLMLLLDCNAMWWISTRRIPNLNFCRRFRSSFTASIKPMCIWPRLSRNRPGHSGAWCNQVYREHLSHWLNKLSEADQWIQLLIEISLAQGEPQILAFWNPLKKIRYIRKYIIPLLGSFRAMSLPSCRPMAKKISRRRWRKLRTLHKGMEGIQQL